MDLLHTLLLRVRSLLGLRSLDRELDDELRFHVDMQAAEHVRRGVPARVARRLALAQFGGVDRTGEECRDMRSGVRLHAVLRAFRLGARRLRREPSFLMPAAATLALGVGALTAIFTLADTVLLRPLPYRHADRIVVLSHTLPGWGIASSGQSAGTFMHYLQQSTTLESAGAWFERELSVTETDNPERVQAALVTTGVLQVLGVQPQLGRSFTDDDEGGDVVMLSHDLWQTRYGGDDGVIGRSVRINGVEREIIGVLPPRTDFPRRSTQMLFAMGPGTNASAGDLRDLYMEGVGLLRPGVTVAEAEADLAHLLTALPARFADVTVAHLEESRIAPRVERLAETITADARGPLVLLLSTASLVLLIALANVANLVLVRSEHQRREIAVERALGAGDGDVAMRLLAEHALLCALGVGAGLLLAWLAVTTRFGLDAWHLPRLEDAALGTRSVALAVGAGILTCALLSLVALARTRGVDMQAALKGALQRATPSRQSRLAQQALGALQVALACALLVASAVMVRSVTQLMSVPLGFTPEHTLAFDVALPARAYSGYTAQASFHDELQARLRALPGVQAAGAVTTLPLTVMPNWSDAAVRAPDMLQLDVPQMVSTRSATAGYFHAMGIPILRGRTFSPSDVRDDGAGVIIAASAARALFGRLDVVGRTVELPDRPGAPLTIVGVAGDVRAASLGAPAAPLLYFASIGAASVTGGRVRLPVLPGEMTHVVRSTLPAGTLLPAVRAALRELDPSLPLAYPRTLDELAAAGSARARVTAWLLLGAAAGALLLGIVGIYGVVAYAVARRGPELALRMVLGASPRVVTAMVIRQGAAMAVIGIVAGVAAALALTRLLAGLLYQVSPHDPLAFTLVPVLVLAVALLASAVPALRASRTPPALALSPDQPATQ